MYHLSHEHITGGTKDCPRFIVIILFFLASKHPEQDEKIFRSHVSAKTLPAPSLIPYSSTFSSDLTEGGWKYPSSASRSIIPFPPLTGITVQHSTPLLKANLSFVFNIKKSRYFAKIKRYPGKSYSAFVLYIVFRNIYYFTIHGIP